MDIHAARKSPKERHADPTDPLDFLNSVDLLSGMVDASGQAPTQANLGGFAPFEYSPSTSSIPDMADSGNAPIDISAQLELRNMSFNEVDFNSMEIMSDLLNSDPTLFFNGMPDTFSTGLPVATGSAELYSFPLGGGNYSHVTHPVNRDPSSSSTYSVPHAPTIENIQVTPDAERSYATQIAAGTSSELTSSSEIEKLTTRARQIVGLNTASAAEDITIRSNKVPIPRLHPSASATKPIWSSSTPADASPSPSSMSANSRTKLSHCAVERRYRTNMKQHIKDLRDAVPALRVLELKPGNRVSNLSLKPGTRRIGVNAEPDAKEEDIVDERGYIDGVKVARNGSKTTAILKTIEYIRVLKRREMRLKREQEGLRTLIRGLPGGMELLQQWETTWRDKYGGPEKDEIDEEFREVKNGDQRAEDEGSMDDEADYASVSGRETAKRRKSDPSTPDSDKEKKAAAIEAQTRGPLAPKKYVSIEPAQVIEVAPGSSNEFRLPKRKRGRPRKAPLPPVTMPDGLAREASIAQRERQSAPIAPAPFELATENTSSVAQPELSLRDQHEETQSGQYLLAMFAFFSFFTSPSRFSTTAFGMDRSVPRSHTHSGTVMVESNLEGDSEWLRRSSVAAIPLSWSDTLQLVHLAFSAFLVFSIMRPRAKRLAHSLSRSLYYKLCRLNAVSEFFTIPSILLSSLTQHCDPVARAREAAQKLRKLHNGRVVPCAIEAQVLREGLGFRTGIIGLILTLLGLIRFPEQHELWRLERRVSSRLVELVALDANSSMSYRLQIFLSAFRFNHGCSSSATELASLALVIYPIWRTKAVALWEAALARAHGRCSSPTYIYKPYETFVLENMSVDEAALRIQRLDRNAGARIVTYPQDDNVCRAEISKHRDLASPLAVLARQAVHEYIRSQAERVFLQIVSQKQDESAATIDSEILDSDRLLVAGRYLDPPTVALLDTCEQVCNPKATQCDVADEQEPEGEFPDAWEWEDFTGVRAELQALLDAIILYRKGLHGRASGSEDILISHRDARGSLDLKTCLDSPAFFRTEAMRNARKHVADMFSTN